MEKNQSNLSDPAEEMKTENAPEAAAAPEEKASGSAPKKKDSVFKDKKIRIRFILFIVALVIAVTSIGVGVYRATLKEEGWYGVEISLDRDLPYYHFGVSFQLYLTGSSNEIRDRYNLARQTYTALLKQSYRLLDSSTVYDGIVNLATLNQNPNQRFTLSKELFDILSDAKRRTEQDRGYSVFAGAYYAFWQEQLYRLSPSDSDPKNDPEAASMEETLKNFVKDGAFSLELDESDLSAGLYVSREYLDFAKDYGLDYPILDLNILYDAYRLELLRDGLEKNGLNEGYIYTTGGVSVSLSRDPSSEVFFYGKNGDQPAVTVALDYPPGCSASFVRSFGYPEEAGYYETGGVRRCPFFTLSGHSQVVSASLILGSASPVETAWTNVLLFNCSEKSAALEKLKDCKMRFAASFTDSEDAVFTDGGPVKVDGSVKITPVSDSY